MKCKYCVYYQPEKELMCSCPKFRGGYRDLDLQPDEVQVENDEGWMLAPGPEFGCIHWKSKG